MTIGGFTVSISIIWLVIAIICLIIEAVTVGLTTVWFAAGAVVSLILSLFDVGIPVQIVVFLVVSICLLVFTRKIFVNKLKTGSEKTNVDALIGCEGLVISDIGDFSPGQVRMNGQIWTAVGREPDIAISAGTAVRVIAIEGVKLIVESTEGSSESETL